MTDDEVTPSPSNDDVETDDADTFLRQVAAAPVVDLEPSTVTLAPGTVVDDAFRVLGTLGHGGMGVVVLAEHIELRRRVALKVHRRASDPEANEILLREARAMAHLSHPNVVTIHRAGLLDDHVFIAMEYVEGTTLRDWIDAAERPWREVIAMFIEVARGLSAAHLAGLVHRDFKPDNVLLGEDGRPRVADFGLAREVGPTTAGQGSATSPGASALDRIDPAEAAGRYQPTRGRIAGTPLYMSPEQYSGDPLDGRSDQYSFCVVLYEALYGHRPHETTSSIDLREAVTTGRLRGVPRGRAPRWVAEAVMRGLSLRPDDRFGSMRELASALDPGPRIRRRRIGLGVGLSTGVLATTIALWPESSRDPCAEGTERIAAVWGSTQRAALSERLDASRVPAASEYAKMLGRRLDAWAVAWAASADAACEAARAPTPDPLIDRRQACLRRAVDQLSAILELSTAESSIEPDLAERTLARLPSIERCADPRYLSLQVEPPGDPTLEARVDAVRFALARVDTLIDLSHADTASAEAADALARALAVEYPPIHAEAYLHAGQAAYFAGDAETAQARLTEAFHLASALGYEQLVVDTSAYLVSNTGVLGGRPEHAEQWARHAMAALERLGDNPVARQELHNALGNFELHRGELSSALAQHQQALVLAQSADPPDAAGTARSLQNLAAVLREQGDRLQALDHLERALALEDQRPDVGRNNRARALHNLGVVLMDLGRLEEAERYFIESLALKERWLGPGHPDVAQTLEGLGGIEEARGRYEPARQSYTRALEVRTAALGPEHPDLADSHTNLANALDGLERREEAVEHHRRALVLLEAAYGPEHFRVGLVSNNLGYVLMQMGRYEDARARLSQARDNWSAALGERHVMLAHPLTNLGALALAEGRPEQALPPLRRALSILEGQTVDPALAGEARLTLAKALWHRDRTRARPLLEQARRDYAAGGDATATALAELERWVEANEAPAESTTP